MSQPPSAQKGPYCVSVEEGKTYFWCSCGLSQKQPFCDGAHKGSGLKSVPFVAEKSGELWLCGCKATQGSPFCDGSHGKVAP